VGDAVTHSNNQGRCRHRFHTDCILSWLASKADHLCPCCRQEFVAPPRPIVPPPLDRAAAGANDSNDNRAGVDDSTTQASSSVGSFRDRLRRAVEFGLFGAR